MNSILIETIQGRKTERPPFWFMRQAGRVLPQYNLLKQDYTFWQLMKQPELAAKVTMMPYKDLNVDALILFSDILVIPAAMGMGLDFTDSGPVFSKPLATLDKPHLQIKPDTSKLEYIYDAIDEVKKIKPADLPLIGFCGAPLTVLLYMLQGVSKKAEFPDAVKFIYQQPEETRLLIDAITEVSLEYIAGQIKHGIDVFQLFDTHAGILPFQLYETLFMPSIQKLAKKCRDSNVPFIFFPKGIGTGLSTITPDYADYLSIDWQTPLHLARTLVHKEIGLQGNIDPRLLYGSKPAIADAMKYYIDFYKENKNLILNLGHGFLPDIPYENAKYLADLILESDWKG